jgi:hypothetical protein
MAVALVLPPPALSQAIPPRVQQTWMRQMREQARMMGETLRQMERLRLECRTMEEQSLQAMEQLRDRNALGPDQARLLRGHERLRDMAGAMAGAAGGMARVAERARDMLTDPETPWNPDAEREMRHLREQVEEMAGQLEEGLRTLERLRARLGPSG